MAANNMVRALINWELALPRYRESARIFRAVNYIEKADRDAQMIIELEGKITTAREAIAHPDRVKIIFKSGRP